MEKDEKLKRTTLFDSHVGAGAKFMEFAGWKMPLQYTGIKAEHLAVRNAAGLFDISHMGQIEVTGKNALSFLQRLTSNDLSVIEEGRAQYTALLNERGGIIDDLIIYQRKTDDFLLCVNAGNTDKDYQWIKSHASKGVEVADVSDAIALLAVQGPESGKILDSLSESDIASIKRFHFIKSEIGGIRAAISRTGYTGEEGFELFMDKDNAVQVWQLIMDSGKAHGLAPAGLGARDTLRLEMGYSLHGNDIDEDHTPYESGLAWICKPEKGEFIGKEALEKQKKTGIGEKLTGLVMEDRGVPRHGYDITKPESEETIGKVTSGTMSPSMGVGIALARIKAGEANEGNKLALIIRGKRRAVKVVRPPFYKK